MAFVAVTAHPKLDAYTLRVDFPVFEELINGKPVAFLDSAASAQKPRKVLDRIRQFYEHEYSNVHRGVYKLAERATAGYEAARQRVADFFNAPSAREVIFTRSATEGLNLGGYMIKQVKIEETTWGQLPYKFEAGTQPIAEAVGFGAALDYISEIGLEAIEQHEHELAAYALERLTEVPGMIL